MLDHSFNHNHISQFSKIHYDIVFIPIHIISFLIKSFQISFYLKEPSVLPCFFYHQQKEGERFS
jgi:hypothetical protein